MYLSNHIKFPVEFYGMTPMKLPVTVCTLEGYDKSFSQGAGGLQHRLSSARGRSQGHLC